MIGPMATLNAAMANSTGSLSGASSKGSNTPA
jgi:hypothetical protein